MTEPLSTESILREIHKNAPLFKYVVSYTPKLVVEPQNAEGKISFCKVSLEANKLANDLVNHSDIETAISSSTVIITNEQGIDDFGAWIMVDGKLGSFYDVTILQFLDKRITDIRCYKESRIDKIATEGMISSMFGVNSEELRLFRSLQLP